MGETGERERERGVNEVKPIERSLAVTQNYG